MQQPAEQAENVVDGQANALKQDGSTLRNAGSISDILKASASCAQDGTGGECRLVTDVQPAQVPKSESPAQPITVKPGAVEVSIAAPTSATVHDQRPVQFGAAGEKQGR